MPSSSPEYYILCQWLDTVFSLPWKDEKINEPDINKAEEILERDHYGLSDVKERIIEYLAVRKLAGNAKGTILCLFGLSRCGKNVDREVRCRGDWKTVCQNESRRSPR